MKSWDQALDIVMQNNSLDKQLKATFCASRRVTLEERKQRDLEKRRPNDRP